jgi:hypothetical protein
MPWKRGEEDTDKELYRVQLWIENTDPILFGPGGNDGMVRDYWDEKAYQRQRDITRRRDLKILTIVLSILTVVIAALALIEANHQIHDHTLTFPTIFHSQGEPQNARTNKLLQMAD